MIEALLKTAALLAVIEQWDAEGFYVRGSIAQPVKAEVPMKF